ncbi:amino acid ABC transporter substrate-binding protein (PAAT family) [Pseudomonas sp. SLBN-26]|jgi:polar amino acid transport system substrate-binding protein|uniref:ABC transporter substrate-binding protein n=1 Tax=Metapseudomonas otitidis TaxID=319939 RepID=A0A679GW07_9GAMM|nr:MULTISPECIES: ABC transporter substrate-binding protein [Pseudomonas]MBO2928014.1 ABC transporter substrate-binding protein [Pseudomonas otitidis]MCO7553350.1 ABC transporter substrate-binding protein [Pseudomonas otitidis]MCP1619747.1 polar amino acid transport system substrate-binding protein [Pseudomonas otitidis]MDI6527785.1 ABC transporter substrate-binding protein [Pseudomonas otitidis]MDU9395609.1 ABC transporter substrate-binding protein [Pseudomonas sp. zfem003]
MHKLFRPLLALGLITLSLAARAELPADYKVVLLTENFPPFNMAVDDKNFARDDGIDGISTDIVREMFKRAGISYNLTLRFPWDRLYRLTQEKPNYGLFSTTYTEERKPQFKWVGPLAKSGWVLLAAPGSTLSVKDLKSAGQYRIGAYKNDAVSQYLETQGLSPQNALRDQENVKKLEKGQIDLWATTDPVGRYLAKQEGVTGLQTVLRFNEVELYLAFNKDTPDEVIERLQKALDQMRAEGFVEEATKNYL